MIGGRGWHDGNGTLLNTQRIVLNTIGFLNESLDQRPVGQFTDEG